MTALMIALPFISLRLYLGGVDLCVWRERLESGSERLFGPQMEPPLLRF